MRKFNLLSVAFLLVFLFGCEDREPLSWESEIFLPIVDDRIGWLDYVKDSMIVDIEGLEIVDGNPAKIVLHQPIDMISGALAPVLPDTSIEENIGIGNVPVPIPVPVDYPFIVQEDELPITNLGGTAGAYLREVVVSSGEMVFAVESSIEGELDMSYYLTCCTIDGEEVGIDLVIPASVDGELGVSTGVLNLENAVFDLTGSAGAGSNLITTAFTAQGSQSNTEVFYATSEDNIKVTVQFHDFEVKSALGYFGNLTAGFAASEDVIDTIPLPNPVLNMEGAVAKLRLENTIGADVRLTFDELNLGEIPMEHPSFFGIHDISRAQWIDGLLYSTTELEINLTEEGGNFNNLIELFPEDLNTVGNIELNPYGDVSLGNDYLDVDEPPRLDLELEIPLNVGIDGVVLVDSFEVDAIDDFPMFDGHLLVDLWSTFPASITADFDYHVNDTLNTVVSADAILGAGDLETNYAAHGFFEVPVNEAVVKPGGMMYLSLNVSTEGAVEFTGTEDVRVQIRIEGTQLIQE
ncbi:MAG: hypothetical protein CL823_02230 [Crocinitomicaceae bacterium]|nr:hypothetical protein [Crocinitomicaceae bacterium]|tara:strand:- start:4818 stop:6380 length:1563 start_codon:yes stop_codon:yes gene_type:complete